MERYEYWVVEAPKNSTKYKGLEKADDPFAQTLMDSMNELGREGWQFMRTETMTEVRRGFFGGQSHIDRDYLVYRRQLRTNGISLDEPVIPNRVRRSAPPNIEQLRNRISKVMTEPDKVVSLTS